MQKNLVYVGTYTDPGVSRGIYVYRRDPGAGGLTRIHEVPDVLNPSFLAFDPGHRFLFAVNETTEERNEPPSTVSSFAIDQTTGDLRFLNKQLARGGQSCHLTTDPTGRYVFVANHEVGTVATFPVGVDGRLAPASDVRQHVGSGPGPSQKGPHAHFVTIDSSGKFVLVADKGIDRVMIYRLDAAGGRLVANDPPWGTFHAGAAPRHIAFHPTGRWVYVNGEADMTVTAFAWDSAVGAMTEVHYVSTLPSGASGRYSTAQIVAHPSGRFIYVSNRGHDTIAIFAVDVATGRLTAVGHQSTEGRTPRNFQIDPSGTYLYAGNQNSDSIVPFRIDLATGGLTRTGPVTSVGAPVCILFGPT